MADIRLTKDSDKIEIGARSGGDLNLYHNSTNSFIENETGILYVTNKANTSLILGTNNTTAVTIDNSQNVTIEGNLTVNKAITFNETSAAADFRVESDDNTHMLFVDGSEDRVGIGTDSPASTLEVAGKLTVDDSNAYIDLKRSGTTISTIGADATGEFIVYDTSASAYRMIIDSSGNATFAGDIKNSSDSKSIYVGASDDLRIVHDGSNSYIDHENTGDLKIRSRRHNGDILFYNEDSGGTETLTLQLTGASNANFAGAITINTSNSEQLMLKGATSPYLRFYENTTAKAYIQWHSDGYLNLENSEAGTNLAVGANGVGIGTTSPDSTSLLTVGSTTASDANGILINRGTRPTISGSQVAISCVTNGDTGGSGEAMYLQGPEFHFMDDDESTKRMVINSSGNVGINEASPDHKLHLTFAGDADFAGDGDLDGESIMKLEGANNDGEAVMIRWANHGSMNNYFGVHQVGASGQGDFVWTCYDGSNYAETFRVKDNGNVIAKKLNQTGSTSNRYPLYWVYSGADGSIEPYTGSVRAMKKDIADMGSVNWINSLRPRSFKFRDFEDIDGVRTYKETTNDNPITEYGLIAEEVDEVEGSDYIVDKDSDGKVKGVLYHNLVPILLKALQEQNERIEALENA
tara:strand:+ start:449 stop:2359 length:1911 start_codon:yes stop_codon:yes gene_type:complete